MSLKQLIRWFAVGIVSLPVIFYLVFVGLLEITERQWLGKAPAHRSTNVRLLEPHQLPLLDVGMDSLATRLQMIEQAKRSIDLEFFIYELDTTSRLISNALVRRAREGLQVRGIVYFARPEFARKLQAAGVQVRYYNTAGLLRFFAIQHRAHRKMLIVDNEVAIVGGRNIGDDYFDLSHHYNFLDSDIWMKGSIVRSMAESFHLYWTSEWTDKPRHEKVKISDGEFLRQAEGKDEALAWFQDEGMNEALNQALLDRRTLSKIYECSDVQFITDYPGSVVEKRVVYRAIIELAREAKHAIRLETPYFTLRGDGLEDFCNLGRRGVKLNVLTNSVRWGVHAKRAIIDDQVVVVETYNIDPRSANLNSELVLICWGNKDLARDAIQSFELRKTAARLIIGSPNASGKQGLLADTGKKKIWITYGIMPFASLFDFLL